MNFGVFKWQPHQAQKTIYEASKKYRFMTLVCARRFGKTELCVNKLIRDAWENPGDYVYIAPTLKQAKRIAWRKIKRFFPDPLKKDVWKNEQETFVENLKGGRVLILGADDPDNLRGEGWKGAILDEFATMNAQTFSVVEASLADNMGYCWFIGTPKGYDHFYEFFIRDIEYSDPNYRTAEDLTIVPDKNYKSFKFKTSDNPFISAEAIKQAQSNLTTEMFAQEYEASFENYTGLIYKEFMALKGTLILEPIRDQTQKIIGCKKGNKEIIFQKYWNFFHGLDTGRYTAGLFVCVDEEQNEYVFDEIYEIDGLVQDIATKIKNKQRGWNFIMNVIDSASQVKREYQLQNIKYIDSQKDILGSIEMLRSKMKNRQFYVLSNCKAFIKELSSRKWDEKRKVSVDGKRKNVPEDVNDHCCNAIEYLQLTCLKYPRKITTPANSIYEKSLAKLTRESTTVDISERG